MRVYHEKRDTKIMCIILFIAYMAIVYWAIQIYL